VAPLAGDAVGAVDQAAVDHEAAAATGAQNDREGDLGARRGAVDGFGQGQAVGVVGQANVAPQRGGQVLAEGAAVQVDGVGIAHDPGGGRDRAGQADAHRADAAGLLFDPGDQITDRLDRGVVGSRIGRPDAGQIGARGIQGGGLDLGAAKINADLNHQ
jgi:hypothetical protein